MNIWYDGDDSKYPNRVDICYPSSWWISLFYAILNENIWGQLIERNTYMSECDCSKEESNKNDAESIEAECNDELHKCSSISFY